MGTRKEEVEYDPNDELAQWVGGYFNGEGTIVVSAHNKSSCNINARLGQTVSVGATAPESAGLFDGEGWISVNPREKEKSRINYTINKNVGVKMTTLHDIERFALWLKTIGIDPSITDRPGRKENWNRSYEVQISSITEVEIVLENLFPYLSKCKGIQAYIVLNEIFPRLKQKQHLEKRGFLECMSWVELIRKYQGNRNPDLTFDHFNEERWPNVNPRQSHLAPSKDEFEKQLRGEQERETFDEKTGPGPRSPDPDWDGEDNLFE